MITPIADDRKAVMNQIRKYPMLEMAERVAEYLDDNYYVNPYAAMFLLEADARKYAVKIARRLIEHLAGTSTATIRATEVSARGFLISNSRSHTSSRT